MVARPATSSDGTFADLVGKFSSPSQRKKLSKGKKLDSLDPEHFTPKLGNKIDKFEIAPITEKSEE